MSSKGQITMFLIVGLAIVIAVVMMIFIVREVPTDDPQDTGIIAEDTLARGCLQESVGLALAALKDDGLVTVDEGGIGERINPEEGVYLTYDTTGTNNGYGTSHYYGLCDVALANKRAADGSLSCDNRIYALFVQPSIQAQLEQATTRNMQGCLSTETTETAEIIIREEGIVAKWSSPPIQYTERTPIHLVFRTIEEFIRKEATQPLFDGTDADEYECEECEAAMRNGALVIEHTSREQNTKDLARNYNNWTVLVNNEPYITLTLEHRGAGIVDIATRESAQSGTITCNSDCSHYLVSFDNDELSISYPEPETCSGSSIVERGGVQSINQDAPGIYSITALQGISPFTGIIDVTGPSGASAQFTIEIEGTGGSCP